MKKHDVLLFDLSHLDLWPTTFGLQSQPSQSQSWLHPKNQGQRSNVWSVRAHTKGHTDVTNWTTSQNDFESPHCNLPCSSVLKFEISTLIGIQEEGGFPTEESCLGLLYLWGRLSRQKCFINRAIAIVSINVYICDRPWGPSTSKQIFTIDCLQGSLTVTNGTESRIQCTEVKM